MEHMKMRWRGDHDVDDNEYIVVTDEREPWHICRVPMGLPNDDTGELTAQAIVGAHNEGLEAAANE